MDLFKKMFGVKENELVYIGGYSEGIAGTTSSTDFSLTSLTGGLDTSPSEGDIVIIGFGVGTQSSGLPITPSGYTELADLEAFDAGITRYICAYKVMESTPDTVVNFEHGTNNVTSGGAFNVQVWRGQSATPIDVTTITKEEINTVLVDANSITPITTNAIIIVCGAGAHDEIIRVYSASNLDNFLSAVGNDTFCCTGGMGSYEWSNGAYDPTEWTFDASDSVNFSNCNCTIALRPA